MNRVKRQSKIFVGVVSMIILIPNIYSLLRLVYYNTQHTRFYLNMLVGVNLIIASLYIFMILAKNDKRYNKLLSNHFIISVNKGINNPKNLILSYSVVNLFIVFVASFDLLYYWLIKDNNETLIFKRYHAIDYIICSVVILINIAQIAGFKNKIAKVSSSIIMLSTYIYIQWITGWSYILIGIVTILLYLVCIKVISRQNYNKIMSNSKYRGIAYRFAISGIIITIGLIMIWVVYN